MQVNNLVIFVPCRLWNVLFYPFSTILVNTKYFLNTFSSFIKWESPAESDVSTVTHSVVKGDVPRPWSPFHLDCWLSVVLRWFIAFEWQPPLLGLVLDIQFDNPGAVTQTLSSSLKWMAQPRLSSRSDNKRKSEPKANTILFKLALRDRGTAPVRAT